MSCQGQREETYFICGAAADARGCTLLKRVAVAVGVLVQRPAHSHSELAHERRNANGMGKVGGID